MKTTLRLFAGLLSKPAETLASLASGEAGFGPPLAIFAFYSVLHAFILPWLPRSFIPEAPAAAFGNPFYRYLAAAPLNLLAGGLLAAFLPCAAAFFSAGRIALRILASVLVVALSFLAASASEKFPGLAWFPPLVCIASAALAFRARKRESRALFAVILASAAVSLAMLPAEILAIVRNSKPAFEIFSAIEAVWILFLLAKTLALMGYSSVPRTVSAVFFTAAFCGALIFGAAKLLPEYLSAILLIS